MFVKNLFVLARKYFYYLLLFLFFCVLYLFIFRSLLFSITTHLPDWNDYPYIVWIMFQNIHHVQLGQWTSIFNGNIFYPDKGVLLFADLFLPQSLLSFPVTFFSSNPILAFNISFISTLLLNIIACLVFWKSRLQSKILIFFATLITALSPFTILNLNHYQVITFWPFFLGLTFLLKNKLSYKNAFLVGLFLVIQFLGGVYLSIFMIFIIVLWIAIILFKRFSLKGELIRIIKYSLCIFFTFAVLGGPFLYSYISVENNYHIKREYWEYVQYSAHVSDYVFSSNYGSLESKLSPIKEWNSLNKHVGESAGFPGFLLIFLSGLGLWKYFNKRNTKKANTFQKEEALLFFSLIILGFIFSLGPRLNFNGAYIGTILPYDILVKLVPLVNPIRANARWSFLFYIGLIYFSVIGLKQLLSGKKQALLIGILAVALYSFEILPVNLVSSSKDYYGQEYSLLGDQCLISPETVLEYPLSQDTKEADVVSNLSYRSQMMLASVTHRCNLVNGYSGYIPKDYQEYEAGLFTDVQKHNEAGFWQLINQRGVNIVKLNKLELYQEKEKIVEGWLKNPNEAKVLLDDPATLIVKVL